MVQWKATLTIDREVYIKITLDLIRIYIKNTL